MRRRPQAAVRWPSFMSAENVSVKADRRVCLLHRSQEFESLLERPAYIPQIGAFFFARMLCFSAPKRYNRIIKWRAAKPPRKRERVTYKRRENIP